MTAATRTGLALLLAALILGVCPTTWPAAPGPVVTDAAAVEPTLTPPNSKPAPSPAGSWRCGSVPGGGTLCTSGYLPASPQARMVAAAVLEMRVTRSARGGTP